MLIQDFGAGEQGCIAMAERAKSEHDRALFIAMARAWCGVSEEAAARLGARAGQDRRMRRPRPT